MDLDKLFAFAGKFGFAGVVAVWFMWKAQAFFDSMTANQATVVELLRQLVALHQR